MPINYSTTVKNARLQVAVDAIGDAGTLTLGTSDLDGAGTGELAFVPLANPPFTINNGVMTLASVPRTVLAEATGVAELAELRHSDGTVVVSGLTVGTVGTDIIINAVEISEGQTVQVYAGTITHA